MNTTEAYLTKEIYAKSKIMCMTSRSEGFCIAVLEAMYFGAYPILTDFGRSVQDVTNHGQYGSIVPQNNVKILTEVLEKVAQDGELNELNFAVERFARDNFSYDVWTKKLDEYLTDLLAR